MTMPKFKLVFRRSNGANLAQFKTVAEGRDAAFEVIRDRLGMGWILTIVETM
jgi:hypothetical protein